MHGRSRAGGVAAADVDDEFAEWDSAETINAVEQALSALGEVVRLEANADFPRAPRARLSRTSSTTSRKDWAA